MAGDTRLASYELIIAIFSSVFIQKTHGYYCRPDWCNENEYCCGFDECCNYLTGFWYLWLLGGVMLFSFLYVCCWMRHRKQNAPEYKHLYKQPQGYILHNATNYGEPHYVHQQPSEHHYGPSPTQAPYISTSAKGAFPSYQATQRQTPPEQPPPYQYTERRTPTAPPLDQ